jgi:hypothetical protein
MREGAHVTKFSGKFTGGSVIQGDTRIAVNIKIEGERRGGEAESEQEAGERLPSHKRNVSIDYGRVGIDIQGRGVDSNKVNRYVSDLSDDIQVTLEGLATEV